MKKLTFVVCLFIFAAAGFAEESKLYVVGKGSVQVKPDTVIVSAGATTEAETAAICHSKNREIMDSVYKKLRAFSIDDKDVKTETYSLQPKYIFDNTRRQNKISGYTLTHIFRVKYKDTKKAGELADALISAGATNINNISFTVEDEEKYKSLARQAAVKDARKKADELASGAGVVIKNVFSIQETEQPEYYPRYYGAACLKESAGAAAVTPVMEGEDQISMSVSIVYNLKD